MKRYWAGALTALLLIPAVLIVWGFLLPCQYDHTFLGELKYKIRLLEEESSPKIILLGGSAAAFGVDSEALEAEFPEYSVVNFGMYAALGTTVMLDLSEEKLQEGDIVILLPEQSAQTLSEYFDAAIMWQGLDGAFDMMGDLPAEKLGKLLGTFPAFAGQKFNFVIRNETPSPQGIYSRSSFNEYGDVDNPSCIRNIMPGGCDAAVPVCYSDDVLADGFADRVNEYAVSAAKAGADVWYAYCPVNEAAVRGTSLPDEFDMLLRSSLNIPVIGDPDDSLLAAEWFYDTNFHLNSSGKQLYTRIIAENMRAMLGDSRPVTIAVPEMPEMAEEEAWQGNDDDSICFTYAGTDSGWMITGLTDIGKERESLTLPSLIEGKPVRTVSAGAFAEGKKLRSICLQRNIRNVEDGAFSGCNRLEKIVVEQDNPSACRVGQGLLEGTSAVIMVPESALSDYRTDYFWSVYAAFIQALS